MVITPAFQAGDVSSITPLITGRSLVRAQAGPQKINFDLKYFFRIFVYMKQNTENPNTNTNNTFVDEFDNWYPDVL